MTGLASAGVATAWVLLAMRLWALLRISPTWRMAVGPWWNVVAAGLASMLAVAALPILPTLVLSTAALVGLLIVEFVVGSLLGLVAALPGYALLGAATGSSLVVRTGPKPFIALTVALVLATALSLGLHQPLMVAAIDTLSIVPLGAGTVTALATSGDALRTVTSGAHTMLVLALALVTPALLAGVTVEVAARMVGRGQGPATVARDIAPWLRLAAALVALGVSWSAYAPSWARAVLAG